MKRKVSHADIRDSLLCSSNAEGPPTPSSFNNCCTDTFVQACATEKERKSKRRKLKSPQRQTNRNALKAETMQREDALKIAFRHSQYCDVRFHRNLINIVRDEYERDRTKKKYQS